LPSPAAIRKKEEEGPLQETNGAMIIDSVTLPFLGSRLGDQACFEYLLQAVEEDRVCLVIPRWVVSRERLKEGDTVQLNLPFEVDGRFLGRGMVGKPEWRESLQSQECSLRLEEEPQMPPGFFFSLQGSGGRIDLKGFSPPEGLLFQTVKDSILLKRGILIYLNHLIPYFSRISEFPSEEYRQLRGYLFEDIQERIGQNKARLEDLFQKLSDVCCPQESIPDFIDLEELRTAMESEIHSALFEITFDNALITENILAIKEQENRLYYSYNTIVMLFIKYL
jgi:hypothetical protein